MTVEIRIPTLFRPQTGGAASVSVEGDSLESAIAALETQFPGLAGQLRDPNGALHRYLNIYVNDEDARYTGGLETNLSEGTVITILPAVAGG